MARNTAQFFGWSVAIALLAGVIGLIVSFYASTATGATIVLVAMGIYLVTLLQRRQSARE
jgi:ABC-type Mn2+/Zn2+ transport system permease subunit